jgi:hypothetical protein
VGVLVCGRISEQEKGEEIIKPDAICTSVGPILGLRGSSIEPHLHRRQVVIWSFVMALCFCFSAAARAQTIYVDCTVPDTPTSFHSINAALSSGIGPWATILIS